MSSLQHLKRPIIMLSREAATIFNAIIGELTIFKDDRVLANVGMHTTPNHAQTGITLRTNAPAINPVELLQRFSGITLLQAHELAVLHRSMPSCLHTHFVLGEFRMNQSITIKPPSTTTVSKNELLVVSRFVILHADTGYLGSIGVINFIILAPIAI